MNCDCLPACCRPFATMTSLSRTAMSYLYNSSSSDAGNWAQWDKQLPNCIAISKYWELFYLYWRADNSLAKLKSMNLINLVKQTVDLGASWIENAESITGPDHEITLTTAFLISFRSFSEASLKHSSCIFWSDSHFCQFNV